MEDSVRQGEQGTMVMFQVEVAEDVTKSDDTILEPGILYVGGTGDVEVRMAKGNNIVTFKNIPDGTFLPVIVSQVRAATTATDIIICRTE